ncbi:hypothetical protein QF030_004596 [Streptomyces rishiriensis]|uniref:Uncharacterized protein n=1 Tax=Streptomyces rishiriensis TaxID=68264 RepID=A0ABU0NUM0_STRRH|nr:hypothetical protein [Streptomyces rishiriensis]
MCSAMRYGPEASGALAVALAGVGVRRDGHGRHQGGGERQVGARLGETEDQDAGVAHLQARDLLGAVGEGARVGAVAVQPVLEVVGAAGEALLEGAGDAVGDVRGGDLTAVLETQALLQGELPGPAVAVDVPPGVLGEVADQPPAALAVLGEHRQRPEEEVAERGGLEGLDALGIKVVVVAVAQDAQRPAAHRPRHRPGRTRTVARVPGDGCRRTHERAPRDAGRDGGCAPRVGAGPGTAKSLFTNSSGRAVSSRPKVSTRPTTRVWSPTG